MTAQADLLHEVPLFALLDETERQVLAERVDVEKFEKGKDIFLVGDPGDSMLVVASGQVEIFVKTKTGEKIVVETPSRGDFFGEIALLDPGPRNATARALTDVEVLIIDRGDLDELFRLKPSSAMDLLAATGRRLRQTSALLRNVATRNPNEEEEDNRSTVQKVADWIAEFSGSLTFLFIHLGFFAAWIGWNTAVPAKSFDAYPYGFLTLVVSLEAIILSVFVLLSANRQVARDKVRNDIEYDVNLKAEMEISHVHEKVDLIYSEIQKRLERMEKKMGVTSDSLRPPSPPAS